MPRFAYQTRDASGQSHTGVLEALSLDDATRMLRRPGAIVVDVRPQGPASTFAAPPRRVRHDEIIFFANQLAVMVDTGVNLTEALDSIAEQSENLALKAVVRDLSDEVKGGTEFSAALEKYPKIFNGLFVALMKASEASGTMGQMLQRVSDYMTQEREIRKRIKGAMTYPVCMLIFCVLVVVAMLVFVLPRFQKIYAGKSAVLPLPTRLLLGLSSAIVTYWPFILVGLAGLAFGLYLYFRSPGGRLLVHRQGLAGLPVPRVVDQELRTARQRRVGVTQLDVVAQRGVGLPSREGRGVGGGQGEKGPVVVAAVTLLAKRLDGGAGRHVARADGIGQRLPGHALAVDECPLECEEVP